MKALQIEKTGGPEVMELVEIPTPEPGPGQVRVKMEAAGLNYSDIVIRRGGYVAEYPMPLVLGREFVGAVEKLGEGASRWNPGEQVMGTLQRGGAFAEFIVISEKGLTPCPDGLSPSEAVGIPIQGATAVHLVDDMARVQAGETVLIHAAAGGVGLLALQICLLRGAAVIGTTSSDEKCKILETYGITAINYSQNDWVAEVLKATKGRGADVILDSIGGEIFLRSFREALAPFGRMVVFGNASGEVGRLGHVEPIPGNKTLTGYFLGGFFPDHADRVASAVKKLLNWIAEGKVKVVVGHTFPLAAAKEAVAVMESRQNVGKVVITG